MDQPTQQPIHFCIRSGCIHIRINMCTHVNMCKCMCTFTCTLAQRSGLPLSLARLTHPPNPRMVSSFSSCCRTTLISRCLFLYAFSLLFSPPLLPVSFLCPTLGLCLCFIEVLYQIYDVARSFMISRL